MCTLFASLLLNWFSNRNLIALCHWAKTGDKKKKKNSELGIIVCVMYLNVFCFVAYLIQVVKWGI